MKELVKKTSQSKKLLIYPFLFIILNSTFAYATTKLMFQPAISQNNIAFIYAEDLWVADKDGSNPIRLTVDEGIESNPIFSPDGSSIAFNAQYDGNNDIYIVPVKGGIPKRLTWHPYSDSVLDFSKDGSHVLFSSRRSSHTNRYSQLHQISIEGGRVSSLPIPTAFLASYSDNDSHIAYTPNRAVFTQWKNYRGGTASKIWLYNTKTHKVEEISKPQSGSNDSKPQWSGNHVYFRSDRNGEFNLFSFNTETKNITQLTQYRDFPVLNLNAYKDTIIYEQAGLLHIFDTKLNKSKTLNIEIHADLQELRTRYVSGKKYVNSAAISPTGARVVTNFRGDIVTVPVKKGDPNNLTQTPGSHENNPQWSPDGKSIAYFSNSSDEYALHIKTLKTNKVKIIELNGTGFYAFPHWSPDSKKVSYVDNGRNLYYVDLESSKITKIATDKHYIPAPYRELFGSWSHDSQWISYTQITENMFENAYLYSLEKNKSYDLSDGLSNLSQPVFDPSGKYLYTLASTNAGPLQNWFDQSSIDMKSTNSIYLITLQKDEVSPFKKENNIEEIKETAEETDKSKETDKKKKEVKALTIDWQGINNRIVSVPLKPSNYSNLRVSKKGVLYYTKPNSEYQPSLYTYDIAEKKEESLMPAQYFELSADESKILSLNENIWSVSDTEKEPKKGEAVNFDSIKVKINPTKEWQNIFTEAWNVNRDYFYDPGMHGVDWPAMKIKYQSFMSHLTTKNDLYRVMQWMFSELSVGHHRFNSRGDHLNEADKVKGGLLGADFKISNKKYKVTKIYGGLNWNPELRSPLTEPGVNVDVGDYILAVNGRKLNSDKNIFQLFENTADKITKLTVAKNANGKDSRTVEVTPIASEYALRNRDWVEGNIKKVNEATDGQVAYVYVPNTADAGHEYFKRYFFPQVHKKAIIIDERYNGGGYLADYYIDLLNRPENAYWNFRYGNDQKAPHASIQGPKVMIADENAGSGGDYLPYLFRRYNLGTIVGKTTWGGLVGVLGFPQFLDGGSVSAPNVAFYNEEGFGIENEGVAPDVEIDQWPEEVIKGHDPQLEKAIEIIKQQLKESKPSPIKRPDYPDKVFKYN
jgi:tricorn protease